MTPCIIWGGTGQAKVVRPILERDGCSIAAVFDNGQIASPFGDIPLIGGWEKFCLRAEKYNGYSFVVAIGGTHGRDRAKIGFDLISAGLIPATAIHHRSFVADSATVAKGCQVLAMAAICEEVQLGPFTIVNTNASVDHECKIGMGVHIMPGATIAGCVEVGNFATIGSNATVLPRIKIGEGAIIGAGAVITKDVTLGSTVAGVPASSILRESDTARAGATSDHDCPS